LGEGYSGVVYQARGSLNNQLYAIKLFTANHPSEVKEMAEVFEGEVNKMQLLQLSGCPHLPTMKEWRSEPPALPYVPLPRHFMVLNYADKGNLEELL